LQLPLTNDGNTNENYESEVKTILAANDNNFNH